MKGDIIEIEDGLECYILDEIIEDDNQYIYCVQSDEEKDMIYENYIICKVTNDLEGNSYIEKINDKDIFERIGNLFIERLKENE